MCGKYTCERTLPSHEVVTNDNNAIESSWNFLFHFALHFDFNLDTMSGSDAWLDRLRSAKKTALIQDGEFIPINDIAVLEL